MIALSLNVSTGLATLTRAHVTAGQPCPVEIKFTATPDEVALQLAIGQPLRLPDSVFSFIDVDGFAVDDEDDKLYRAVLDGNDTRLVTFMANKTEATMQLGLFGEVDGVAVAPPYLPVAVQPALISGDPSGSSGPSYPTTAQMTAAIAAALASIGASGINLTIVKLTGTGSDPTALDGQNTSLGGYELGQFVTFDVADAYSSASVPAGICTYQLITHAAAVVKYGASTDNLPFIVRPNDWSADGAVWERRS